MHLPCLKYELVYEHLGGVSEGRKDLQPASSFVMSRNPGKIFALGHLVTVLCTKCQGVMLSDTWGLLIPPCDVASPRPSQPVSVPLPGVRSDSTPRCGNLISQTRWCNPWYVPGRCLVSVSTQLMPPLDLS